MTLTCLHLYLNRHLQDGLDQPRKKKRNIEVSLKLGTPNSWSPPGDTSRKGREAYNAFLVDLVANDTTDSLNQDPYWDPNQNYTTFHDQHTNSKEKHLPYKFVKFNKYRHKSNKCITRQSK